MSSNSGCSGASRGRRSGSAAALSIFASAPIAATRATIELSASTGVTSGIAAAPRWTSSARTQAPRVAASESARWCFNESNTACFTVGPAAASAKCSPSTVAAVTRT